MNERTYKNIINKHIIINTWQQNNMVNIKRMNQCKKNNNVLHSYQQLIDRTLNSYWNWNLQLWSSVICCNMYSCKNHFNSSNSSAKCINSVKSLWNKLKSAIEYNWLPIKSNISIQYLCHYLKTYLRTI